MKGAKVAAARGAESEVVEERAGGGREEREREVVAERDGCGRKERAA